MVPLSLTISLPSATSGPGGPSQTQNEPVHILLKTASQKTLEGLSCSEINLPRGPKFPAAFSASTVLDTRPALPGVPDPIAHSSLDCAASVHQFTDSANVCFEPTVCQELDLGFRYREEQTSQPPTSK